MPVTNGITNNNAVKFVIPTEMKAIRYNKIKDFSLVTMPVPEPKAHEILIKGKNQTSSDSEQQLIAASKILRRLWYRCPYSQRRFRLCNARSHWS
jgi:hypothetical protein